MWRWNACIVIAAYQQNIANDKHDVTQSNLEFKRRTIYLPENLQKYVNDTNIFEMKIFIFYIIRSKVCIRYAIHKLLNSLEFIVFFN